MAIKEKSDRDQERGRISAGGWEVAYGDVVNEFDVATGVIATCVPQIGIMAWLNAQILIQLQKFKQSLNDISPALRNQAIQKVQEIVTKRLRGEWNVGGIGIKAGVATYRRWWKLSGIGGWQKNLPNFQPYIGFRIVTAIQNTGDSDEVVEEQVQDWSEESAPSESPSSPPPSPIGTYEGINLGLTEEEKKVILAKEEQESLPPAAIPAIHAG